MTPAGLSRLKLDEGLRLTAYQDSTGIWTIGYGQTGTGITKGVTWSQAQADGAILARIHWIETQLSNNLAYFNKLSPVRQDVLINIAYNIGVGGLLKWTITLAAASRGEISAVAEDIRTNKVWKSEVGDRVDRCADAYEKGEW